MSTSFQRLRSGLSHGLRKNPYHAKVMTVLLMISRMAVAINLIIKPIGHMVTDLLRLVNDHIESRCI